MSTQPLNPKNVYRMSLGKIVDGKLVEIISHETPQQIEMQSTEGDNRTISAFTVGTFTLTATFTIKKWQPNPFDPHALPTRWYLHRKKFTSQN